MTKGWTEERRRQQAERIRQSRPWEKSTGPRTEAGKKRIRYNARKHGRRTREYREFRRYIRMNLLFIDIYKYYILADKGLNVPNKRTDKNDGKTEP